MSVYVFALQNGEGLPNINLLELVNSRVCFEKIFSDIHCFKAAEDLSQALRLPAEVIEGNGHASELALKQSANNILLLLSPQNAKELLCLNFLPTSGFSYVLGGEDL